MKLQHLAIIFILIIFPISMVLGEYMSTQIKTIQLQNKYTNILTSATYDMMKAFQINTVNNRFSTVSDSKIRDLEAGINTFYTSLSSGTIAMGLDRATIETYTPAIVCTLYDGYYIYSQFDNIVEVLKGENDENKINTYGLKPYIYYSCRYQKGTDYDFVVNYTLDNMITVYGKIGSQGYVTKTGYLINPDNNIFSPVASNEEVLTEWILISETPDESKEYSYIIYENEKVYYDPSAEAPARPYFWYRNGKKEYISDAATIAAANGARNGGPVLKCDSSRKYAEEAEDFSRWIRDSLSGITETDARTSNGTPLTTKIGPTTKIFNVGANNDPLKEDSAFNAHRLAVMRNSIETNLVAAINNYNLYRDINYEFGLPKFSEQDWDKILHNISFISFLQGIPIGAKYYNNYVAITNDKNKEFVSEDAIYLIDSAGNYHQVGCQALLEGTLDYDVNYDTLKGYSNINFTIQHLTLSNDDIRHFYLQKYTLACYECIVNAKYLYDIDEIIAGTAKKPDGTGNITPQHLEKVRSAYLRALARERYNLYKTNAYFGT